MTPPEWSGADERLLAEMASTGTWKPTEKDLFRKDSSRVPVLKSALELDRERGVSGQRLWLLHDTELLDCQDR